MKRYNLITSNSSKAAGGIFKSELIQREVIASILQEDINEHHAEIQFEISAVGNMVQSYTHNEMIAKRLACKVEYINYKMKKQRRLRQIQGFMTHKDVHLIGMRRLG